MELLKDGGPAFPMTDPFVVKRPKNEEEAQRLAQGMSMRDYFAAMAMCALLASPDMQDKYVDSDGDEMSHEPGSCGTWYPHTRFFADSCYIIAEQMLQARNA